jgi:hypothetical protein
MIGWLGAKGYKGVAMAEEKRFIDRYGLPAIRRSAGAVLETAHKLLVTKGNLILERIGTPRDTDQLATQHVSGPGGEATIAPVAMKIRLEIQRDDILGGVYDAAIPSLAISAQENAETLTAHLLRSIGRTSEAVGNVFDFGAEPLTHDKVLDIIERLELDFDADGKPKNRYAIVVPPNLWDRVAALPPMTPEQEKRAERIIEAKREEWRARQRSRRLS